MELNLPKCWDRLTVPELIPDVIFAPLFGPTSGGPIPSVALAFFGKFKEGHLNTLLFTSHRLLYPIGRN